MARPAHGATWGMMMQIKARHRYPTTALLAILATLLPASGAWSDQPAPPIELDDVISAVTVYSDQAAVTRSASLRLGVGRQQVAFHPLPAGAQPESVQVEVEGADLLAVELLPPWPKQLDDGGTELRAEQRRLQRQLADLQIRYQALRDEAGLLTSLARSPSRKEGEIGAALLASTRDEPVGRWQQARLHSLAAEAERLRVTARASRRELDVLARQLSPPASDGRVRAVATLSLAKAATVTLRATTRISGPRWVPDYDLQLDPEAGLGRLSVNALVSQATGEDWSDVPLTLSTATPGAAADLPKLSAWYLQEQPPEPEMDYAAMDYDSEEVLMEQAAPRSKSKKSASSTRRSRRARAQAPAEAPAMAEAYGADRSYPQPTPSYEPAPPPPENDLISRLLGPPPDGQPILAPPQPIRPQSSGPVVRWSRFDPAVQAGGFDYALHSVGLVSIPADGAARRIPLLSMQLKARFEHRIPSAVEEAAYLYALLEQDGEMPLLAGEARVFQSGDLLGSTTLPTSARGATFEIPLGKDEQIQIERKIDEVADRSGLLAGGESLSRTVTLTLRNLRPDTVHAVITDRIPVTFQDKMKVQISQEPSPPAKVGSDGLIHWTLDIVPGADQELSFSYLIRHPRNSALKEQ